MIEYPATGDAADKLSAPVASGWTYDGRVFDTEAEARAYIAEEALLAWAMVGKSDP